MISRDYPRWVIVKRTYALPVSYSVVSITFVELAINELRYKLISRTSYCAFLYCWNVGTDLCQIGAKYTQTYKVKR